MSLFIVFFLFFWWVRIILFKYELPIKIQALAAKKRSKFLNDLSECEFCIENHIACIIAVGFCFYCQDYIYLTYGPMSAALSNIIKTMRVY